MKDKYKDIKKYLNRAYELTKTREKLEREYKKKREEVGSISVSNTEIKGNSIVSNVENKAIDLFNLEEKIKSHNIEIDEARKEIADIINQIKEENLTDVLRLRYLEFRKWEDIAYILNYSRANIFILHNKALKKVDEILKD